MAKKDYFNFRMWPNDKFVATVTSPKGESFELSASEFMAGMTENKPLFKNATLTTRESQTIAARSGEDIYNCVAWSNTDEVGKDRDGKRQTISSNGRVFDWCVPRDQLTDIEHQRYLQIDVKPDKRQANLQKKSKYDF